MSALRRATGPAAVFDVLRLQEKALRSQLELARAPLGHAASKGDVLEIAARNWLRKVLPKSLWVGRGQIIDTRGNMSDEHDVIIAHDSHPRFFDEETPQPFFLEGVAAVLEIKASIDGQALKRTINANRHLRALKHCLDGREINLNGSKLVADVGMAHQFAFTMSPPFALFAYESKLSVCELPDRLGESSTRGLDAVFALEEVGSESSTPGGWCAHYREGNFRQVLAKDGQPIVGWHHHHEDLVLAAFLTWLTGAINYTQYDSGGIMSLYWQAARNSR